jgi:hypothetical protein
LIFFCLVLFGVGASGVACGPGLLQNGAPFATELHPDKEDALGLIARAKVLGRVWSALLRDGDCSVPLAL